MQVKLFEDYIDPALDCATAEAQAWPSASITQHIAWPKLATPSRVQRYRAFTCTDAGGQIVSAGLIRLTQLCPGRFSVTLRRGPSTRSPNDLWQVMPALEKALHKVGAISISVNPFWRNEDAKTSEAILAQLGYARVENYEQTLPTATAMVDLHRSEEAMLASLSSRRQRDLRAVRAGTVAVRTVGSMGEATHLTKIMREMAKRTNMEIDSKHDFGSLFRFLKERPHLGVMNAAIMDDKIIGGSVMFYEGDRGLLNMVTAVPGLKGGRSTSLYWQAMLDAKEHGCRWLDMDGYPDPRDTCREGAAGRQEFKDSFHPVVMTLAPIMSRALRPIEARAYRGLRRFYRKSQWKTQIKALLHQSD
jgi:lipid II:glycine glycyltransferase (peptidoglycan interpeptide bridge formation enzyme)